MRSFTPFTLVLVLLPLSLAAQETSRDTSTFRAGQWGLQFGLGSGLLNLGILRFTSPSAAWMLRLDFRAEFLNGTSTTPIDTTDTNNRSVYIAAGIGRRFYQAPHHKVRSFQSLGIAGSYADQKQPFGTTSYTSTNVSVGPLGELGGAYWVTPNLSLGGTATVSAGYEHRVTDDSVTKVRQNGWFISGVNVFLSVGLYF